MMAAEPSPEIKAAITKGAVIEALLLVIGGVLFYFTGQFYWIVGFALVGSVVMLALMAQAGAFNGRNGQP
jgi:hypothetical protein